MKNKVFFINFPKDIRPNLSKVSAFYTIKFFDGAPKKYHFLTSTGLFIYKAEEFDIKEDYFREIVNFDIKLYAEFLDDPLTFLDTFVGRKLLINPRQTDIIQGTIVRSKADPSLGPGVVKEIINENYAFVHFPKANSLYSKKDFKCHKSILRVLTHIEEVR